MVQEKCGSEQKQRLAVRGSDWIGKLNEWIELLRAWVCVWVPFKYFVFFFFFFSFLAGLFYIYFLVLFVYNRCNRRFLQAF